MKKKIDGIIVVEGKSDVAFLNEFLDAEFVITNGSEISKETIDYLKKVSVNRHIFVLTDPDSPGKRIRDVLDQNIKNLCHCFVRKEQSIKHGKVGVAESNKEEILSALENYFEVKENKKGSLTMSDLYALKLVGEPDSFERRKIISEKLHLGFCNAKTFLKRLNNNVITIEELKELLWTKRNILKQ